MTHIAYVGLGSNVGGPLDRIDTALSDLHKLPQTRLQAVSSLYRSEPWGLREQPDFVNAVARLATALDAFTLLAELRRHEDAAGRERSVRWGPRALDLDLLLFDNCVLESDELTVPHPRMHLRAFVLLPLLELDPAVVIPGRGSAASCLQALPSGERAGVERLADRAS